MTHTLNIPVSFYANVTDKTPKTKILKELLNADSYKSRILEVRKEADPQKQNELKKRLPMYTISGVFSGAGNANLVTPSNLLGVDIDAKDNGHLQDFANLKEHISHLPFVAYCGRSCRGKGFFLIIPIASHIDHKAHFLSLAEDFKRIGINIDAQCGDIGRRRFISYDDEPYINQKAETYRFILKSQQQKITNGNLSARTVEEVAEIAYKVGTLIEIIHRNEIDITDGRDNWVKIGFALSHEFGEAGRPMFHQVSKFWQSNTTNECYDYDVTDHTYNELMRNNNGSVKIGTFFKICKDHNIEAVGDFDRMNDTEINSVDDLF